MQEKCGWDQGIDEGRAEMARKILLVQGKQLFGKPSAKTEAAISSMEDPDRLDRMLAVIMTLKSWQALLAVK